MTGSNGIRGYFRQIIPISARQWRDLDLHKTSRSINEHRLPPIIFYRHVALLLNRSHAAGSPTVYASHLNLFAIVQTVYRYMIDTLAEDSACGVLEQAMNRSGYHPTCRESVQTLERFVELFPPVDVLSGDVPAARWLDGVITRRRMALREMLLLHIATENPAVASFRDLFDDGELADTSSYTDIITKTHASLREGPFVILLGRPLGEALRAPILAAPDSLAEQIRFIRDTWRSVLPPELLADIESSFDILHEEEREHGFGGDPGPPPVLEFTRSGKGPGGGMAPGRGDSIFAGFDYPEYEQFSPDADWMSNVVLMSKMVYVWLDQLSRCYGYAITRLDQIPDAELDRLADWGFTGLWLIGLWERSSASQRIKQICGNPEAIASAYSLYDYEVAEDLGGWNALANLRDRAARRGIRLASDMVPNHTGIYSRWMREHPDWFIQTDYPPFPSYQFTGADLSGDSSICLQIEDGYWSRQDAAVVFKYHDRRDGRTRYIYHGNDGTSTPWNDTAQLNYLIPEVREAVIQTIMHVARTFPIIRFDAAMTLAKKHYQRLWFPLRGLGGGIPSRAGQGMSKEHFDTVFPVEFWREVVDRVTAEVPGTLLLAEAFWMMEGYFVRTLGMHRVYNSAFMNMLKTEENHKYRHTIKNVLEFNPEVLKRFVNFMNNPDEKTAVEQFGTQDKYFGACVLLATMPGLPMFGHGQIEGFHEKYGMEYKRAYWIEAVDEHLVRGHELWIFPLLRRRWLFSGSENFMLYDFYGCDCINENVFAYSNRAGEHRSLILYHNSFSTAAGWIRESAGFAVPTGNGEPNICRTTVGTALGLSAEEGLFCAFCDHVTGLSYLRNARELYEYGLYVELKEYQFYLFLDFRTIRDDSAGSWEDLCTALEGRGVESLEDEVKQLRYRTLNESFTALIEQMMTEPVCTGTRETRHVAEVPFADPVLNNRYTAMSVALRYFLVDLLRLDDRADGHHLDEQLNTIETRLTRLAMLEKIKPLSGDAKTFQARLRTILDSGDDRRVLVVWMVMAGMNPGFLEQFGLDCTLKRMLGRESAPVKLRLLNALLSLSGSTPRPGRLFSLSSYREFLNVHESGGTEWFNKERFEEIGKWQEVVTLLDVSSGVVSAATLSAAMGKVEKELRHSREQAAHAGYRCGLYQRLMNGTKPNGTQREIRQ